MTLQTIQKLNQLNQRFYQEVAEPFSQSREKAWTGWDQLLPYIAELLEQKRKISVLDLGCGNGRFGVFLKDHFNPLQIKYAGVDTSERLLTDAKASLRDHFSTLQLTKVDIIESLLDQTDVIWLNQKWDVIVCFGVIHHLPSEPLRRGLIEKSLASLESGGLCVLAAWQFMNSQKLQQKVVSPETVGISPTEMEPNDYILSWERGKTAYRYCHHVQPAELENFPQIKDNKIAEFFADGKENNLNYYLILEQS